MPTEGTLLIIFAFLILLFAHVMGNAERNKFEKRRAQEELDRQRKIDSLYGRHSRRKKR